MTSLPLLLVSPPLKPPPPPQATSALPLLISWVFSFPRAEIPTTTVQDLDSCSPTEVRCDAGLRSNITHCCSIVQLLWVWRQEEAEALFLSVSELPARRLVSAGVRQANVCNLEIQILLWNPPSGGWRNELHSTVASWHARPAGFNGCAPVSGSFLWQGWWWWWCLGWFHFYLFVCRLYFLLMNTVRWDATKPESSCKVGRCSSVQVFSSFQIFGERGLCIHFVRERWM